MHIFHKPYYINAQSAFEHLYHIINNHGEIIGNTKAIINPGFYIFHPEDNIINTKWRNWKKTYADREWEWYLSQNRSVSELKKYAKIWDQMHNGDDIVNSNYGWQWNRNGQLDFVINELKERPLSRRAVLTIYDGKEHLDHFYDTPCTLNITFNILHNQLNMSVLMRSNDLWYGFCNDQYCFSKLQQMVADKLSLPIGWYYHFVNNLHIYESHYNRIK